MSEKNARIQDRTPYRGPVWIMPAEGSSLVGDVRNVSQGGMFVNVVPTPPIGQEIVCELPGYRAVRGRVVWISSPTDLEQHGVGIEFVDLTDRPTPILAMPTTTYTGIEFAGPLDFLREGSEVQLATPNGHRQLRARVADVELDHAHGATHLSLSLVIAPAVAEHVHHGDEQDWFPEITVSGSGPIVAATRVATPIVEAATIDAPIPTLTEPQPAVLEAIEPESSDRNAELLVGRRDSQLDDTLALLGGTVDDTERTVLATPSPVAPTRSNALVPFAAVTVLILGGLALVRLGFPTAEAPAPMPVAALKIAAPVVAVAPPVAPPAPMMAEPMIVPAAKPVVAAAKPVVAVRSADPSTWKPEITESKGEPSVLVPLEGSLKGMTSFLLDQPQGIAVDLPNASLAITAKSYLLHHPSFGSLWVRKMDKGVQIRLHVTKGVHVEAVVEDGALRIRKK